METIQVIAAVWKNDMGQFFIAQRNVNQSLAGLWEFPGGKLELGETDEEALAREFQEEFGIESLEVGAHFMDSYHEINAHKAILLKAYCVETVIGAPIALEHAQFAWVHPQDFKDYNFPAADLPIVERLLEQMKGHSA